MKRKAVLATGIGLVMAAVGATTAVASGDDGDQTVTGPQAARASASALAETGGGRVDAVSRDSEAGATWEVEVIRPDGVTVEVRLDSELRVVVVEADDEDAD